MSGGYVNRVLHVDLSKNTYVVHPVPEEDRRMFIGGSGLAAKFLMEYGDPKADPFSADNPLIFMTGPFTGTKIPLSGRHEIVAKSPLTGIYGESDAGGAWGMQLKKAGFDGIVFRGRAEAPLYVWIHDLGVEFRDADHLWGLDTYEADEVLRKETDAKAVVSCIGPAGERLARISGIMHDGRDGRAAARCGVGAVMGSKRLKAVVAFGDSSVPLADEEGLSQSIRELGPSIVKGGKRLHDVGTSGITVTLEQLGDLPIKNWAQGRWEEGAAKISGETMAKTILTGRYYCGACIIGCGREVRVEKGPYAAVDGAGPEYETVATLGALCLVDDLEAIAKAHELCNRYGLDVISTGGTIAFAMEAYEKGLLSQKDIDGVKLEWGNAEAMVAMVEKIGRREGFGWILGEGSRRVAERIGGGSVDFAVHVKGLEFPAHDPRAYNSLALGYATSNRGACHLQGFSYVFERSVTMSELGFSEIQDRFGVEGKWELAAKTQNLMSLMDSLKLCKFLVLAGVKATHMLDWLTYVTGWQMSLEEFLKTGERIFNLKRLFNVKCGASKKDDVLPRRILTLKRGSGGAAENLPPYGDMIGRYYEYRGWDGEGKPTKAKTAELGLSKYL